MLRGNLKKQQQQECPLNLNRLRKKVREIACEQTNCLFIPKQTEQALEEEGYIYLCVMFHSNVF